MKEVFLIGVDIGTQGTKTVIYSSDGRCVVKAFAKSNLLSSIDSIEEDPEDQLNSVYRTIRECVDKSGILPTSIVAIGIVGQMAGIIGIGKEAKHITPYDS